MNEADWRGITARYEETRRIFNDIATQLERIADSLENIRDDHRGPE